MFGKEPKVFRNSSLIYSDDIGGLVASMGFKGMLTEGAKQISWDGRVRIMYITAIRLPVSNFC